jgi:hypothetical protein
MTRKEIQQKYAAKNSMFVIAPSEVRNKPDDLCAVWRGGMLLWFVAVLCAWL